MLMKRFICYTRISVTVGMRPHDPDNLTKKRGHRCEPTVKAGFEQIAPPIVCDRTDSEMAAHLSLLGKFSHPFCR